MPQQHFTTIEQLLEEGQQKLDAERAEAKAELVRAEQARRAEIEQEWRAVFDAARELIPLPPEVVDGYLKVVDEQAERPYSPVSFNLQFPDMAPISFQLGQLDETWTPYNRGHEEEITYFIPGVVAGGIDKWEGAIYEPEFSFTLKHRQYTKDLSVALARAVELMEEFDAAHARLDAEFEQYQQRKAAEQQAQNEDAGREPTDIEQAANAVKHALVNNSNEMTIAVALGDFLPIIATELRRIAHILDSQR